jgi:hypothetical protein
VLKKVWIPLVLVVVLAVSGLVVSRLHKMFASQDLNANAGAGIEIVQFNPKILVYDVWGPPGTTAQISYFDPDANVHLITVPLPWSTTLSTTLPAVSANLMAQGDSNEIGCRVTVNGTVREEHQPPGSTPRRTACEVRMTATATRQGKKGPSYHSSAFLRCLSCCSGSRSPYRKCDARSSRSSVSHCAAPGSPGRSVDAGDEADGPNFKDSIPTAR